MSTAKFKIILFFCLSAIIFNFNHPLSGDEGAVLNGAWQIAHGKIPYLDFFNFVAPGSFYFAKWSFDLLGTTYFSVKFTSILLLLISACAVYKISKYITKIESVSLVSAWFWLLVASNVIFYPIISYNSYSTFTLTIAIFFLIKGITLKNWVDFLSSGLMLSLTIVTLQHKGIIITIALFPILAILFIQRKVKFANFVTLMMSVSIFPLIAISYWGIKPLWENLILWPLKNDVSFSPIPEINIIILLIIFALLTIIIWKKQSVDRGSLLITSTSQIALIASIYSRLDAGHLLINSFGLIIIGTYSIYLLYVKYKLDSYKKTLYYITFFTVISLYYIYIEMNIGFYKIYKEFKKKAEELQITQIYAHPFLPQMYFELKLANPYRYDTLYTGIHPQVYFIENLTTLLLENPKHIIVSYDAVQKFNFTTENPIDQYIMTHYKTKTNLDNITFLEKSE